MFDYRYKSEPIDLPIRARIPKTNIKDALRPRQNAIVYFERFPFEVGRRTHFWCHAVVPFGVNRRSTNASAKQVDRDTVSCRIGVGCACRVSVFFFLRLLLLLPLLIVRRGPSECAKSPKDSPTSLGPEPQKCISDYRFGIYGLSIWWTTVFQ